MIAGELCELERELGHAFGDRSKLERAVTHSSLAFEQGAERGCRAGEAGEGAAGGGASEAPQDNERLEFLGDAVIGLLTAEALWARYPELREGDLTRLRAALVSRRHMGQVALEMGLGEYLRLGRGEERSGGRKKSVLLANTLEAVLGALYLDGGMEAARQFALRAMLQARKAGPPEYQVKAETGPDHRKRFLVEVRVAGLEGTPEMRAQGSGSTKKRAEQEAARRAFAKLGTEGAVAGKRESGGRRGGAAD
jgi:ribonuclease-3